VLISGASTGFGSLAARALADAGHRVFAGMRDLPGHNAAATEEAVRYSQDRGAELRPVESVEQGVQRVLQDSPRLDVLVHHAGDMVSGPAEAFTPEQLAELYDVNVLGTQRLNRAAYAARAGRAAGVGGQFEHPGRDDAVSGAVFRGEGGDGRAGGQLRPRAGPVGDREHDHGARSFTHGTSHYAHSGKPADEAVAAEYETRYSRLLEEVGRKMAEIEPPDADVAAVAQAIVTVVDTPKSKRPFRVHADPTDDGATVLTTRSPTASARTFCAASASKTCSTLSGSRSALSGVISVWFVTGASLGSAPRSSAKRRPAAPGR
jgi:NAD(P)-dependent dehydrogenase (short-subunit alcohol dehydrogenase family)